MLHKDPCATVLACYHSSLFLAAQNGASFQLISFYVKQKRWKCHSLLFTPDTETQNTSCKELPILPWIQLWIWGTASLFICFQIKITYLSLKMCFFGCEVQCERKFIFSKLMALKWYKVLLWKTVTVFCSPEITWLMWDNGGMYYSVLF